MSNSNPLLPLLVLSFLLLFAALIAYGIYVVATGVADQANKKMEQRHMSISKGGMVVGVREKGQERYVDQTQRFVFFSLLFSFLIFGGVLGGGLGRGTEGGRGMKGEGGREGMAERAI